MTTPTPEEIRRLTALRPVDEVSREAAARIVEEMKDHPIEETLRMLADIDEAKAIAETDGTRLANTDLFKKHPRLVEATREAAGGNRQLLDATGFGTLRGVTTMHMPDGERQAVRRVFLPSSSQHRRYINEIARSSFPRLCGEFSLPAYRNAGNYRSYRMVEESMIGNALDVCARIIVDGYAKAEKTVAHIIFGVSLALKRDRFPIYWVGKELVDALRATDLPKGIQFDDVHWPHRSVIFMLPQGSVVSPNGSEIVAVSIARMDAGEELCVAADNELSVTLPSIRSGEYGGAGVWALMIDHHVDTDEHRAGCLVECHVGAEPTPANWALDAQFSKMLDFEHDPASLPEVGDVASEAFLTQLPRLAMNLLLTLALKPELIERTGPPRHVKRAHATNTKTLVWDPRFLGRRYRFARERSEALGGTHASPRTHWRRGHWRDVRVGARLAVQPDGTKIAIEKTKRGVKPTWIEPILVNANEEAKS